MTYGGRPYLIQFGEWGETLGTVCPTQSSTFSRPHIIDIADERNPRTVSTLMNEVALPENCAAVSATTRSRATRTASSPTRGSLRLAHVSAGPLHDPDDPGVREWLSGLRVYDIRDPLHAKELAYFNPARSARPTPTVDMAAARPVIRPERGEIWFATVFGGFHVLRFEAGLYPFGESLSLSGAAGLVRRAVRAREVAERCGKAESTADGHRGTPPTGSVRESAARSRSASS